MALTDAYATYAEYNAVVGASDTGSNTAIESDLKAVSRWLDRRLGRFFNQDNSVSTRVYIVPISRNRRPYTRPDWAESENPFFYGGFQRGLEVDDIATTNSLEIKIDADNNGSFADDTALNTTDYELLPRNAPQGPEPRPYTRVEIPSWSQSGGFNPGGRVQINAVHGWGAVPAAIKLATIRLTATIRTGLAAGDITAGGVKRVSVSGGLAVDYGGTTETAAKEHTAMLEALAREYGRARRFI